MSSLALDQLLEGARYHADLALTAYSNRDERSILVNAAVSLEHLSKALLFSMHPTLLAETQNGSFDALLLLNGFGDKTTKQLRTIGAKVALLRVRQVMEIHAPKDALDQLIAVRDGVLHAGLLDSKSTRELLTAYLRYAEEVYDALEDQQAWGDDRWGKWDQLVASLITQSLTEVEHEVTRKIEAARANHRAFMERVPESEQEAVAESLQIRTWSLDEREVGGFGLSYYGLENIRCPACNHPEATIGGMIEEDYDVPENLGPMDHIEEHVALVAVYLRPTGLRCGVCNLELIGADEMRAARMPERIEITSNVRGFLSRRGEVRA